MYLLTSLIVITRDSLGMCDSLLPQVVVGEDNPVGEIPPRHLVAGVLRLPLPLPGPPLHLRLVLHGRKLPKQMRARIVGGVKPQRLIQPMGGLKAQRLIQPVVGAIHIPQTVGDGVMPRRLTEQVAGVIRPLQTRVAVGHGVMPRRRRIVK